MAGFTAASSVMIRVLLLLGLWCTSSWVSAAGYRGLPLPTNLIAFDDPMGQEMLLRSGYKDDFWTLNRWFLSQEAPAYCGIAASVMVLNALGIPAPPAADPRQPALFTQQNFFTDQVARVLTPEQVSHRGVTLDGLAAAIKTFPLDVRVTHARPGGLYAFINQAKQVLQAGQGYLIVNYLRSALGQQTYGHFSPVAAYDEVRDRFLILDVARYKYPPVWVRSEELFAAMQAYDRGAKAPRGYLILAERRAERG
jgi:hypothetical protein